MYIHCNISSWILLRLYVVDYFLSISFDLSSGPKKQLKISYIYFWKTFELLIEKKEIKMNGKISKNQKSNSSLLMLLLLLLLPFPHCDWPDDMTDRVVLEPGAGKVADWLGRRLLLLSASRSRNGGGLPISSSSMISSSWSWLWIRNYY